MECPNYYVNYQFLVVPHIFPQIHCHLCATVLRFILSLCVGWEFLTAASSHPPETNFVKFFRLLKEKLLVPPFYARCGTVLNVDGHPYEIIFHGRRCRRMVLLNCLIFILSTNPLTFSKFMFFP